MNSFGQRLPAYLQMMSMVARIAYVYRFDMIVYMVAMVLQIYLLRVVWTAVYAGRESAAGLDLTTLISYLTLAQIQTTVLLPDLAWRLHRRVREGTIAIDLTRPVPFLPQLLAQTAGDTAGYLPFAALALPLAMLAGGLQTPASTTAAILYLLSLVLAYLVTALIGLLIGLIAFWTLEFSGFMIMYRFVNAFLAGALVPLTFFPPWLRTLAELLPFQTQAFLPVSIYLGQAQGEAALRAIGVQAFWVVLLAGLAQVGWRRAMGRVIVQGG